MAEKYDGSIRINTEIETKNVNSQMLKVVNTIKKTENQIGLLKDKMHELETVKIPTTKYAQLQKELAAAENKADNLYGKLRLLEKSGEDRTSEKFRKLKIQIEEADKKVYLLREEMEELDKSGKAFRNKVDSEEYKKAADRVQELKNNLKQSQIRLEELNKKASETTPKFQKTKEKAKELFTQLINGSKSSGKMFSTLASRTKGILLSLLIFNNVTTAWNAMIDGIKTGFHNLVQYADEYNVAMSQLKSSNTQMKNSIATAFGPIVQMAVPHLITLINYVTEASNRVAQFTAVLSGKDTWTKAKEVQENYADSLKGTAAAASKAKGALASFDTLEVLNKKDNTSGAGENQTNPKDMFEEVPIENEKIAGLANKFKDLINAEDWNGIGTLLSSKLETSLKNINWQDVYKNADSFGTNLAAFLNGTIRPSTFKEVGKTAAGSLNTGMHFLNSFGKEFGWENFGESLSEGVKGFLEGWDAELTGETFSTFVDGLLRAATEAIETAGENDTFEELGQKFVDFLCGINWGDLVWDLTNLFVALQDAAGEFPADFARGVAQSILQKILGQKDLKIETPEWLDNIIESLFKGPLPVQPLSFVKMILPDEQEEKEQLAHFLGKIKIWLDGDIKNLFTEEKWTELTDGMKAGLLAKWEEFKVNFDETGAGLWMEENVKPWFTVEKWQELGQGILEGIMTKWQETKANWSTSINEWWTQDVHPWFTVEKWKTIGENMKKGVYNGFYGIVSKAVDVVNAIIASAENMVNNLIEKMNEFVNKGISAYNALSSAVGGKEISFNAIGNVSFGRVPMPNIPALADGAVIRGGNPFMAMLGDQPHGQTNIEAPLSTIEEALRGVMSEQGNAGRLVVEISMDGEKLARVFMDNWLSEANRRGLNVDLLEGYA